METVLVVDDERNIIELVRLYLGQAGFRVVEARDRQDALVQHERVDPDLIVLDLMPGLDGMEVTREVRRRMASRMPPPPAARSALTHLFDRFSRVDPSRAAVGSSPGLAIVRDLAEAFGGGAFAENTHGGGSRVGVRLPTSGPTAASGAVVAPAA